MEANSQGRSGPRVLIVDDDKRNRALLGRVLAEEGISVVGEAADGYEALERARSLVPDVVLMDLRMAGMGGIEATRLVKESLPTTQVVILTQYEGPLPTRSAEQVGAYAYLVKGCSAELMTSVILHAWSLKKELEASGGSSPGAGPFGSIRAV